MWGRVGDCYPLEIVSTPQEYELVTDRGWLQDGESVEQEIPEEAEVQGEIREERDIADILMKQLSAERESDAVLAD